MPRALSGRLLDRLAGVAARAGDGPADATAAAGHAWDDAMTLAHDGPPIRIFARRYEIAHEIASGGMGSVYRARDLVTGDLVALKVFHAGAPELDARLRREAAALAALGHPNVVRSVAHGTSEDGAPYVAMELLDGETLAARLARGPVRLDLALGWTLDLAEGLGAAHALGIVHRDVKPENVMLLPDGRLKLVDFGLSRRDGDRALTRRGERIGTLRYMAPEQLRGEPATSSSDVYALGAVLYESVTGRRARSDVDAALGEHTTAPALERLPQRLRGLVLRLLAEDPRERPVDGAAAAELVREVAPRRAGPTSSPGRPGVEALSRRRGALVVGAPGSGKTARAGELARAAISLGIASSVAHVTIESSASVGALTLPRAIVRAAVRAPIDAPPSRVEELVRAAVAKDEIDGAGLDALLDPRRPGDGDAAVVAFARCYAALLSRAVLVLDGLERAHPASVLAIAAARRASAAGPILVVTASPEIAGRLPGAAFALDLEPFPSQGSLRDPPREVAPAPRVRDGIAARYAALDPFVRWVLRAASLFGSTFAEGWVAALVGRSDALDVARALDLAASVGVLAGAGATSMNGRAFAFASGLAYAVVHATLSDADRRAGEGLKPRLDPRP